MGCVKGVDVAKQEQDKNIKVVARNKKARFEWEIIDTYEAGLVLEGSEVKALRDGGISIDEAFVTDRGNELYMVNMKVPTYKNAGFGVPEPARQRKLLLHKKQIHRIIGAFAKKGLTCVPLMVYFKEGWVKAEVALVRHRTRYDKRERMKERDSQREMERYMKRR
jgi:SsrA-binding protein